MSDDIDRANDQAQMSNDIALRQHQQHAALKPGAESAEWCEACGIEIPELRRHTVPGVTLCVDCKREQERQDRRYL